MFGGSPSCKMDGAEETGYVALRHSRRSHLPQNTGQKNGASRGGPIRPEMFQFTYKTFRLEVLSQAGVQHRRHRQLIPEYAEVHWSQHQPQGAHIKILSSPWDTGQKTNVREKRKSRNQTHTSKLEFFTILCNTWTRLYNYLTHHFPIRWFQTP